MRIAFKTSLLSALFVLLCAPLALAHTLWVEVPSKDIPADKPLDVNIGFNEGFEVVEILKQSVEMIAPPVMLGKGGETKFKAKGTTNYAYESETPVAEGSYLIFADYKPFIMGHGEGAKNNYIMTAKHLINVGKGNDDLVVKPQNKSKLEIVPLENPANLKAGGTLPVQVLFDGKPLKRATLLGDFRGFNPAGSWGLAKAFYCNTDKDGKVNFLPTKGGLWILKVRHAVPNEDKTEAAETVYLSNVTFFVGE